jgi:hypothetical protein
MLEVDEGKWEEQDEHQGKIEALHIGSGSALVLCKHEWYIEPGKADIGKGSA